jgi:hypothetical protein
MLSSLLLRWDGLHLVIGLDVLQVHLDRLMRRSDRVTNLTLEGREDTVRVFATVAWKGVSSRASLDLSEIRLKHRILGFRMRRLTVFGGLRIPRRAIEAAIQAVDPEGITVFSGDGIVVVDLRGRLPAELDLSVLTVQSTKRALHVWFGSGGLSDVPTPRREALPAGAASGS